MFRGVAPKHLFRYLSETLRLDFVFAVIENRKEQKQDITVNESKTTWFGKNGEKAVQPLFPAFVHISLGVTSVVGILLWLWPASAIRRLSFRLPLTLAAICFLSIYILGEMIRWRFRISLWNMFAVVTLLALLSGGFGAWLLDAHQQRRRVLAAKQLGGIVFYDTIHGFDGKFVTSDGWIVPQKLVDALGVDVFARTKELGWYYGGISDAELATLDLQAFPRWLSAAKKLPMPAWSMCAETLM